MESAQAEAAKHGTDKGVVVSPLNGAVMPKGRRKGSVNKVTATIREAVEYAAREVTDSQGRKGLAAWMLERANGGIQDRQIFAAMVSKALPLTVSGNVAGVTINLGWLEGRGVTPVTVTSQSKRNSLILDADTRSNEPRAAIEQGKTAESGAVDPPSPLQSAGGEGE